MNTYRIYINVGEGFNPIREWRLRFDEAKKLKNVIKQELTKVKRKNGLDRVRIIVRSDNPHLNTDEVQEWFN